MDQLVFVLTLAWGLSHAPLAPTLGALGDEEFAIREGASHALNKALTPDTNRLTVMMWRVHAGHPDLEVRRRVRKALGGHDWRVRDALRPADYLITPSINHLPENYPNRWAVIYACGDKVQLDSQPYRGCYYSDNDVFYRKAMDVLTLRLHAEGASCADVVGLLDEMAASEVKHTLRYVPLSVKDRDELLKSCRVGSRLWRLVLDHNRRRARIERLQEKQKSTLDEFRR